MCPVGDGSPPIGGRWRATLATAVVCAGVLATSLPATAAAATAAPSPSPSPSTSSAGSPRTPSVTEIPDCPDPALPADPTTDAPPQLWPSPTPSASPSPSGTASPAPSPTPTSDPAAACQQVHDDLAGSTQAVVDAVTGLQAAQSELAAAQSRVATARRAAVEAAAAHRRTRAALAQAVAAERAAAAELAALRSDRAVTVRAAGQLASSAYRSGPFIPLSVVLDADDPVDFVDRLDQYESALRQEEATLAELANDSAEVANRAAKLAAQRRQRESLERAASRLLAERSRASDRAAAAETDVRRLVASRAGALADLEAARQQDLARYREVVAASAELRRRLEALAAGPSAPLPVLPPLADIVLTRPGTGEVTSPFGQRFHPILHYVKLHTGEDLAPGDGSVYAAADGRVLIAERDPAYGNLTVIGHGIVDGRSLTTAYAHQARFLVQPGDVVRAGQLIGAVGSTGLSTGRHLHFEVRLDGRPVDPAPYLAGAPLPR